MAKKILIVDDEKGWVQILMVRLSSYGYELSVAFDGLQAMMQLNRNKPDLVLLDLSMPAGGGLTVLKNIRQNIKLFNIPVIVLSGRTDDAAKEAVNKEGASGYFVKPVDMDKLKETIAELLNDNAKQAESEAPHE
ncbi:MAG: response regulator [Candidatus Omnitrophota bacterium]